jgi:hypothetical protein
MRAVLLCHFFNPFCGTPKRRRRHSTHTCPIPPRHRQPDPQLCVAAPEPAPHGGRDFLVRSQRPTAVVVTAPGDQQGPGVCVLGWGAGAAWWPVNSRPDPSVVSGRLMRRWDLAGNFRPAPVLILLANVAGAGLAAPALRSHSHPAAAHRCFSTVEATVHGSWIFLALFRRCLGVVEAAVCDSWIRAAVARCRRAAVTIWLLAVRP